MKYILKCPLCGQMYKTDLINNKYITDYKDNVTNHCLKCNHTIQPDIIRMEDWIADMVFTIKGK